MKKRTVAVVMAAAMTIGMMVTGVSVQAGVEDKTLIVGLMLNILRSDIRMITENM